MKKWLFLLCCAFSLLLNAASGKAVPSSEKKILVLASFHLAHDWTAKLTDTIQADSKNFSPPPQITIVAFDMMRVYESQNSEKKLLHYLSVIQKGKFDMIVALDSPIMNLLLENSDKVPAGIPIVFGGCENISPDIKQKHPNITGVIQKDDAEGTLRAGLAAFGILSVLLGWCSPTTPRKAGNLNRISKPAFPRSKGWTLSLSTMPIWR